MPTTVAIYARVSSAHQARDNTIASQLDALQQRVSQDHHVCSESLSFIDEGCSGSTLLRPALERLRDAAAVGLFDRLYVHSPDRLARRHAHQALLLEELKRYGVEVAFLNRPIGASAEDELLVQVQGVIAEYERAKIQERARRGKRHAARAGAVSVFSAAPYAYRYVPKSPSTPARFEIAPDEAAVVELIFTWVAQDGCSIREVCRRLRKQRIPTPRGGPVWSAPTIRGILRNPAYTGAASYGKTRSVERTPRLRSHRGRPEVPRSPMVHEARPRDEWIAVAVPAIIAQQLFDAVAAQLDDNRKRHRQRQKGAKHLLQGLLVCQHCGYACYSQSVRYKANAVRYGYYRCIGRDRRRVDDQHICHLHPVPMRPLDEAVWQDVRALLADPSRIEREYQRRMQEQPTASPQHSRLEAQRQRVQRGLARLIDAYTEGLLDKDDFEPRLRASKERLREIDAQAKLLQERETQAQQHQAVIHRLKEFSRHVESSLNTADAALRREIVRALVKRVELSAAEVRIVYRIDLRPFDHAPSRGHLRHCSGRLVPPLA